MRAEIEQALEQLLADTYERESLYQAWRDGDIEFTVVEAHDLKLDASKAALIALLARDDARIARLEDVAEIAKAICDDANPDVVDGAWAVPDGLYWELHHALDADAPGGG